jgi:hypothetical protein
LVQRGVIKKSFTFQDQAESYDGSVLRFGSSEDEILNKYKRDSAPSSSLPSADINSNKVQRQQQEGRESEEIKVPLTAEKLDISKETEESQDTITKEPPTETKTVQVPATHEDVTI